MKLTDFGLAKSLGDHQLTNDGDIVGSLHYMPPEQVRRHTEPDPRSDIYSTGAVLYEILTGKKTLRIHRPACLSWLRKSKSSRSSQSKSSRKSVRS